jgi:hypothetical protein
MKKYKFLYSATLINQLLGTVIVPSHGGTISFVYI